MSRRSLCRTQNAGIGDVAETRMIDAKEQFKIWNLKKWEAKNKVMYEVNTENEWPWFHDTLDPDVEAYVTGASAALMDVLDLGTCSGSQAIGWSGPTLPDRLY